MRKHFLKFVQTDWTYGLKALYKEFRNNPGFNTFLSPVLDLRQRPGRKTLDPELALL